MVFKPSVALLGREREEGEHPARNRIGTSPPGRWDSARKSTAVAPRSKTVNPTPRLVAWLAPSVAFGLSPEHSACGASSRLLYSYRGSLWGVKPTILVITRKAGVCRLDDEQDDDCAD